MSKKQTKKQVVKQGFVVEKGVKIPPITRGCKYPFDQMKVGDSFFVKTEKVNTIRSSIVVVANRQGMRVKTRTVEGGFRVWRTE